MLLMNYESLKLWSISVTWPSNCNNS